MHHQEEVQDHPSLHPAWKALEEVSSAKYLGLTISDDMTWNRHIDNITSNVNSKVGFLKRNLKVKDSKLKEIAYT